MAKQSKKQKTQIATDILTPKQEAFCRHYVDIGNATEAYRLSYNTETMKPATINQAACRLVADSKISARVEEIQREYAEQSKVDRHAVEEVLMGIIRADPSELYTIDERTGKMMMKTPSQLPKKERMSIKDMSNNKGRVKYIFNSKTEAARLLGSWNGWNAPTQFNVAGSIKLEIRIGFDEDE